MVSQNPLVFPKYIFTHTPFFLMFQDVSRYRIFKSINKNVVYKSSASCLTLGIYPALPPATPNYKGFASKTGPGAPGTPWAPYHIFIRLSIENSEQFQDFSTFYILAVKEAGDSATYEK